LAEAIICGARFLFKILVGFGGVRCIQRRLPIKQLVSPTAAKEKISPPMNQ
jgi:hypothetical protein